MLLVTYQVPELQDIQIHGVEIAITKGYLALKTWEKSPSIGVCVQRISEMMKRFGIPFELTGSLPSVQNLGLEFNTRQKDGSFSN